MIELFDDGPSSSQESPWKYDSTYARSAGWLQGGAIPLNIEDTQALKAWPEQYYIRQLAGAESSTTSMIIYSKGKIIFAANYRRYVLEIKQANLENKEQDHVLVLLMKNPSSANVFGSDTTTGLAQRLFDLKTPDQSSPRYNHLIIVNLVPFVTSQVIRLDGNKDGIDDDEVYFENRINLSETAGLNQPAKNPSAKDIKKYIDRFTVIKADGYLTLNRNIITSLFEELDSNGINYDAMIATGSINTAAYKDIKVDVETKDVLFKQYQKIMALFVNNRSHLCKSKTRKSNLPTNQLVSTRVLDSEQNEGYAEHPSSQQSSTSGLDYVKIEIEDEPGKKKIVKHPLVTYVNWNAGSDQGNGGLSERFSL